VCWAGWRVGLLVRDPARGRRSRRSTTRPPAHLCARTVTPTADSRWSSVPGARIGHP
jgi:hypothetical protein